MRHLTIRQSITDKNSDAIKIYLKEITRIPLLSIEDERELARKAFAGNAVAREALVKANLRFVVSVAKQFHTQNLELLDLISEGNIGLVKAAEDFNPSYGVRFTSYAVHKIRQSIMIAVINKDKVIRVPVNRSALQYKVYKVINKFETENERLPTALEIADILKIDEKDVDVILGIRNKAVSIDTPVAGCDDDICLGEMLESDDETDKSYLDRAALAHDVSVALKVLKPKEATIVSMFFGIGCKEHSLEEISSTIGMSKERVRQIKEFAVTKLGRAKDSKELLQNYIAA